MPYDVYTGRHLEIIRKRKEVKSKTLEVRRDYIEPLESRGMAFKVSTIFDDPNCLTFAGDIQQFVTTAPSG
jgi:hypothetical protein